MKKLIRKIRELYRKWQEAFVAFRHHPILQTKAYFQNFKGLSMKEKAIKVLWAAAFAFATVYVFWLVASVIIGFFVVGVLCASGGVEFHRVRQAQWKVMEYGGKEADYL